MSLSKSIAICADRERWPCAIIAEYAAGIYLFCIGMRLCCFAKEGFGNSAWSFVVKWARSLKQSPIFLVVEVFGADGYVL